MNDSNADQSQPTNTTTDIEQTQENTPITSPPNQSPATANKTPDPLTQLGHLANHHARQHIFHKYMVTKSDNTLHRHHYDLRLFAEYLHDLGVTAERTADLQQTPAAWTGVTWGLIEGFLSWQLAQGYAITSANARLSTIKNYARLAVKAEIIPRDEAPLLETVKGYSRKEGINLDEKRPVTRLGHKKATPIPISSEKAERLKNNHPPTPAGHRNRLILHLLLDHGLRASEVANLHRQNFDLETETLTFWRQKTKEWTTHQLTPPTLFAAETYHPHMPAEGTIFWTSRKDGSFTDGKLTRITVSRLVQRVGVDADFFRVEITQTKTGKKREKRIGTLSAHDCRHFCATDMARKGYSIRQLMDWFGWTSPGMAMRYVEGAAVQVRNLG